jgi:hypothetical protein
MFCEKCGNKIEESSKFCEKCGNRASQEIYRDESHYNKSELENKWWLRLMKVAYVILYIMLIPILILVWNINATGYSYNQYTHSYAYTSTADNAFWYSFLTLIIYLTIIRLVKITSLYISLGLKPNWKSEFKKLW